MILMERAGRAARGLEPFAIVFLASAAGLVIEIVAARILAPSIGVSLFTWTSIIGIVLAGISVGNYLGGRIADRRGSPTMLGIVLLAGAVASAVILPLAEVVPDWVSGLPILARIVLLTTILFFIPSAILAMVTPTVIKLQFTDLSRTGNVVGKIYAISTFGAIFGVFITGFVLVGEIGSRSTVMLVAVMLVVMAVVFGRLWRVPIASAPFLAAFAAAAIYGWTAGALDGECTRESNYFCIRIGDKELEDGRMVKVLIQDQLVQSYVDPDDPTLLVYGYEEIQSEIAAYVEGRSAPLRALFIGGGGYSLPRFLEVWFRTSEIEVIEIDPVVTDVAFTELGLNPETRIRTYNQDARMKVLDLEPSGYNLIVGDAFNDVSVPYHLATRDFNEDVRDLLAPDGIYTVNIVDNLWHGRFLRAFVSTLSETFEHVTVVSTTENWETDSRSTTVVIASNEPITRPDLQLGAIRYGRTEPRGHIMPDDVFERWMEGRPRVVLTDDFAPVDQMLAPLYLDSR